MSKDNQITEIKKKEEIRYAQEILFEFLSNFISKNTKKAYARDIESFLSYLANQGILLTPYILRTLSKIKKSNFRKICRNTYFKRPFKKNLSSVGDKLKFAQSWVNKGLKTAFVLEFVK